MSFPSTLSRHFEDDMESSISSQHACKKRRISPQQATTVSSSVSSPTSSESSNELLLLVRDLNRFMGVSTQQVRIELLKTFMLRLKEVFSSLSSMPPRDDVAQATEIVSYARSIQSTLLLHLGYTLSMMTTKEESRDVVAVGTDSAGGHHDDEDDDDNLTHQESVLFLLCQCLCQLYEYMAPTYTILSNNSGSQGIIPLLDRTEFREMLLLLSQILDHQIILSNLSSSSSSSTPTMSKTLTTCACLQVAWFLATGLGKDYSMEFANMERILLCLMRVLACVKEDASHGECSAIIHNNNQYVLRILEATSFPGTKARIVYTAARVLLTTTCSIEENRQDVETTADDSSRSSIQVSSSESPLDAKLYLLGCAIQNGNQATAISWEELIHASTQHDALLFVRCLSYSPDIAERLAQNHDAFLEILHMLALKGKDASTSNVGGERRLAIDASDCLSFIACQCSSKDSSTEKLVRMLTSIVCRGSMVVKRKAIHGLFRLTNQNIASIMMSFKRGDNSYNENITCHGLLEALENLLMASSASHNVEEEGTGVNADATRLIASIVSFTCKNREDFSQEYDDALGTLALMLEADHDPSVVGIAVDSIRNHTDNKNLRLGIGRQDVVLTSLSHVALNEFASADAKRCAVEALWNLAQEPANMQNITRTPSVLDALVAVASTTTTAVATTTTPAINGRNNIREQTRRLAIQTLMHLSTLACNGRVLAKQVGLLACLIRFVRSLSATDEGFEKEEMKEQIIKLAMLL